LASEAEEIAMNARLLKTALTLGTLVGALALAAPAEAKRKWDHDNGHHYGEWHGRGPYVAPAWVEYDDEPVYVYRPAPRVIVAPPPPVYVYPRPRYVEPSINFVFPLRFD
jgi:hypothetical protein